MPEICKEIGYPLITVAIPLYGSRFGLRRVLRSVYTQTYPNMEVIVSDDATDGLTEEDLRDELAEFRNIPGFHVRVNKENMGTVAHCNFLTFIASGEYIKFMTSNDSFAGNGELLAYYEFAESQGRPPVVFARTRVVAQDGSSYVFPSENEIRFLNSAPCEKIFSLLARTNILPSPATFYRKDFFSVMGGFDEGYKYLEDWPSWLWLARRGIRMPCLNRVTMEYPRGGISSDGGGVYLSPRLKNDMLLCYQKEIFPYKDRLSLLDRYCAGYFYSLLTPGTSPLHKMLYFPLSAFHLLRRAVRLFKK